VFKKKSVINESETTQERKQDFESKLHWNCGGHHSLHQLGVALVDRAMSTEFMGRKVSAGASIYPSQATASALGVLMLLSIIIFALGLQSDLSKGCP
jgi:hypothetical protein